MKSGKFKFLISLATALVVLASSVMLVSAGRAEQKNIDTKVESLVTQLYESMLSRSASEAEMEFYAEQLQDGWLTVSKMCFDFYRSEEFQARDLTDEEFVEILYQAMLGREPGAEELEEFMDAIERGANRNYIFQTLLDSGEFLLACTGFNLEIGTVGLADVVLPAAKVVDTEPVTSKPATSVSSSQTATTSQTQEQPTASPNTSSSVVSSSGLSSSSSSSTIVSSSSKVEDHKEEDNANVVIPGATDKAPEEITRPPEAGNGDAQNPLDVGDPNGGNQGIDNGGVEPEKPDEEAPAPEQPAPDEGGNPDEGQQPDGDGSGSEGVDPQPNPEPEPVDPPVVVDPDPPVPQEPQEPERPSIPEPSVPVKPSYNPVSPSVDVINVSVVSGGGVQTGAYEDIISQIVYAEVGGFQDYETYKAQAIAAYSYLKHYMDKGKVASLPMISPPSSVVGLLNQAVADAKGIYIQYNGATALTVYSAMHNGATNASQDIWTASYPYLQAGVASYDTKANGYETVKEFSVEYVYNRLTSTYGISTPALNLSGDPSTWITISSRNAAGYVTGIQIQAHGGVRTPSVEYFYQTMFGLRSSCFDVQYVDGVFRFTVQGFGHGVGMSQWGANYLSKDYGWNAFEILAHFYPGTNFAV